MNTTHLLIGLIALAGCATVSGTVGSRDTVVFFGDSITEQGAQPGGYVSLIRDSLTQRYPGIQIVGAGISGNKVTDLEQRLDRDVLAKHPTVVVIYIGINDVWHSVLPNLHGTPIGAYEQKLTGIIRKIQASGARVVLCTPSVVGEKRNGENQLDAKLDEYSGVSRKIAEETGSALCDLRKDFGAYETAHNVQDVDRGILTVDAVHLSPQGNKFVAQEIISVLLRNGN